MFSGGTEAPIPGSQGLPDPGRREPPAAHPWAVVRVWRWPPATPHLAQDALVRGPKRACGHAGSAHRERDRGLHEGAGGCRSLPPDARGDPWSSGRDTRGVWGAGAGAGPRACHQAAHEGVVLVAGGRAAERVVHPDPGKVARAGTRARHASWRSETSRISAQCVEVRSRPLRIEPRDTGSRSSTSDPGRGGGVDGPYSGGIPGDPVSGWERRPDGRAFSRRALDLQLAP